MSNTYIDTRTEEEYAQDRAKYWGKCADYVSNLIGGNGNYIFCGDICYGKFVGVLDGDGNPYL